MFIRFHAHRRAAVLRSAIIGSFAFVTLSSLLVAPISAATPPLTAQPLEIVAALQISTNQRHANSVFGHFMDTYWNATTRTFYSQSDHKARPGGRATAPMWWVAQGWNIVMDDYQRTHTSWDRQLIDDVYNGWIAQHGGFSSNYNDDRGWWALGATRAYQLTGESRFLNLAVQIADDQWRYWDSTFGGGLWWKRNVHDQKNVATNAPAAMINATLYRLTGAGRFKSRAVALFSWVDGHLRSANRLDDRWQLPNQRVIVDYTYNYGTYVGAALDLYAITKDHGYVDKATSMADSALTRLTTNGVLRDEGTGDGGGFKGIFLRNLVSLAALRGSAITINKGNSYNSFIASNANVAWNHRTALRLWGSNWAAFPPSTAIEVLTDSSAVSLFEAQALVAP